jgi:hypothetical protein
MLEMLTVAALHLIQEPFDANRLINSSKPTDMEEVMAFKKRNPNEAESDNGTVVGIAGKNILEYARPDRKLHLGLELIKPRDPETYKVAALIYFPSTLRWKSPCTDPIDPPEQVKIMEDIEEALEVLGIENQSLPA